MTDRKITDENQTDENQVGFNNPSEFFLAVRDAGLLGRVDERLKLKKEFNNDPA